MPKQSGQPTAAELFNRRKDDGTFARLGHYDWTAFCVVSDYCTSPCEECNSDAAKAKDAYRRTQVLKP